MIGGRLWRRSSLASASIPGVQAATITTGVPSRDGGERYFEIDGTHQATRHASWSRP